jgi:hypothetical protein
MNSGKIRGDRRAGTWNSGCALNASFCGAKSPPPQLIVVLADDLLGLFE